MPRTSSSLVIKGQRLRVKVTEGLSTLGFKEEYFLIVLSIAIGCAAGFGAYFFYWLIETARVIAYGDDSVGGIFGGHKLMLVWLPMAGALLVGHITYYFAREAKGHGVPEVMDAIHRQGGVVRPRVAVAKAVASALTIGSGGSAGTEGPIIQIGAAIGSSFGQILRVKRSQMPVLVACGVAAGIAAIFNAPIAGVLFALEIFLRDFSFRTFSPVVFSSVLSCSVTHALMGEDKAIFFADPSVGYTFSGMELPFFSVLGVLCALAGVAFIWTLYKTEDIFEAIKMPEAWKPVLGAFGLGLTGLAFCTVAAGDTVPVFYGNGYPLIESVISLKLFDHAIWALAAFFVLKLLATCLTLGSGGSGGIFAPSLFMGAALGGAFGLLLRHFGLIEHGSVTAYALVGMGALVAASTHAPLTAIVILLEVTREYRVMLPAMFAAIIATAVAQLLMRDSIYTLKLRRRGVRLGRLADLTILKRITVDQVRRIKAVQVKPEDPLQRLLDLAGESEAMDFVVVDEQDVYQGLVIAADIRTALLRPEAVPLLVVGELMRSGVPTVNSQETLDTVLDKFARSDVQSLPLLGDEDASPVLGLITRQAVMARYHEELERTS